MIVNYTVLLVEKYGSRKSLTKCCKCLICHQWQFAKSSVVDPDSDFKWIRIRIRIQIQGFDDQKLEKYSGNFVFFFWSKIERKGLHKGRPSSRRSLQPSKENIQHFNRWNLSTVFYFFGPFLRSWIRIRIRIQGPHWIRIKSGSTTLAKSVRELLTRHLPPPLILQLSIKQQKRVFF